MPFSRRDMFQTLTGIGLAVSSPPKTAAAQAPPSRDPADPHYLSPRTLTMARGRISFADRDLRLFNARGTVSFRPRTVTGLKAMIFVPINLSDPQVNAPMGLSDGGHFNLSFREERTGALIQDIQDEFHDPLYLNQRPKSSAALGPHYAPDEDSATLLLIYQDGVWAPDTFTRHGTYHRREKGELLSFGVTTRVTLSDRADEIFQEVTVQNRLDRTLVLTLIPDQPRRGVARAPCFVREEADFTIEIVCDLGEPGADGWRLEVPKQASATAHVALRYRMKTQGLHPQPASTPPADLAHSAEGARAAVSAGLSRAAMQLPQIETENKALDEFYRRCILSVVQCQRSRENYICEPFYDLGFARGAATPWDLAFASRMLAQADPAALKTMLLAFLSTGSALNCSYMSWDGRPSGFYAQTPFSLLQMAQDYALYTGESLYGERVGNTTVLESFMAAADTLLGGYVSPDGLIDVGVGTGKVLEIRTEGYQHCIAAINALAADFLEDLATLLAPTRAAKAETLRVASRRIAEALERVLWNPKTSWYDTLYPDGYRDTVLSYHAFDMLGTHTVPAQRKMQLAARIRDGEFLAPYGMWSISPEDRVHFDREDCDWGGGGFYMGQPLKTVTNLYAMGEIARAWDLLARCTSWIDRFPYFPQTSYGDTLELQPHQVDWPLNISCGAGVQAIVAGVFGVTADPDGALSICPRPDASMGSARLDNYRWRNAVYGVAVGSTHFEVTCNGDPIGRSRIGAKMAIRSRLAP